MVPSIRESTPAIGAAMTRAMAALVKGGVIHMMPHELAIPGASSRRLTQQMIALPRKPSTIVTLREFEDSCLGAADSLGWSPPNNFCIRPLPTFPPRISSSGPLSALCQATQDTRSTVIKDRLPVLMQQSRSPPEEVSVLY